MNSSVIRALLAVFLAVATTYAAPETHVVIMHTNDVRGHVLPSPDGGGSARLATLVHQVKPDLMLDAGGMLSGSLISDTFLGAPVIDAMNAIGYDAAVVGGIDFNFGINALAARVREANFLVLSANATTPVNEIQLAGIFNAQDVRIAVIGLSSEDLARTGHPQNVKYVDVADSLVTLQSTLPRVKEANLIVLLTNVSRSEEQRIAKAFPEIRLIIGAHEDAELPTRVGQTTIVSAGKFGKYAGKLDLTFVDGKLKAVESRLLPTETVEPDPAIEKVLQPFEVKLNETLQQVVGHAAGDLSHSTAHESHMGNLVADAVRAKTGTEIALINAADPQVGIRKGPITSGMLFEVLPSENTLVTMRLTGSQIKHILGRSVMSLSGVRVKLDANKPEGKRLVSARLNDGTPLHDKEFYTVTTNDFLLMGGDGYTEFADGIDVEDTGILVRDALAEHIAHLGTVSPRLDGRIQVSR
ncbi:MAG TPA: 5'-nucleotidase C-terminal domain-containing protein [Terriglobia bacterium]|nr:5'-nucleotidase C-terminal domain-containing protein [Terriglobia bacterium]